MRDVENAWPPGTPCEFAWKGRWYRAISNGVVDDVLELQEVRARAVTHVELDEVAGSVVPKGTHLEWTADDERKSAALARATAGEPAKCNKPGADSSRKKQPAPEASESAPKQARKQPTDAQQAARSREPDSSDEDASESAPKQARKQSADAQQAARSREPDSSDEDASESAPKQARKQPATSRSQEPDSSEEESGSASMSDDEDGAVDWLKEGQTSGHAFISKRVAIQHDGELAKGTITMWVPANEDAGDEALFHAEAAIALLEEAETAAKARGKRKASATAAAEQEEDDVQITATSGCVALSDFPHSREHCLKFKLGDGAAQHCTNCYCYVCDNPASTCDEWTSHCHAVHTSSAWQKLRNERRQATTQPATKGGGSGNVAKEAWSGDQLLEAVTQVYPREEAEPRGLRKGTQLRPYQRQSLAFMTDVEQSKGKSLLGSDGQRGGWLCDEVGMGKTVVAISLVLANPCIAPRPPRGHVERQERATYKTTLIVVPSMLVQQWEDEVRRFAPKLRVNVLFKAPEKGPLKDYLYESVTLSWHKIQRTVAKCNDDLTTWVRCEMPPGGGADAVTNAGLVAALEQRVREMAAPGELRSAEGVGGEIFVGNYDRGNGGYPANRQLTLTTAEVASLKLSAHDLASLARSTGAAGYVRLAVLQELPMGCSLHHPSLSVILKPLCFRPVPSKSWEVEDQLDDVGQPIYKSGLILGEKALSGSRVVIVEEARGPAADVVKPNRVLIAINGDMCSSEDTARALLAKAKCTPDEPIELRLRTQTRQAQRGAQPATKIARKASSNDADDLADCDVLITWPKGLAKQNFDRRQLDYLQFHRLIIDESHLIGKSHAGEEMTLQYLKDVHVQGSVWLLTGTPLSASVSELEAQADVLGASKWLEKLTGRDACQATADALRARMIRHTKSQRIDGEVALALPKAAFRVEWLDLTPEEAEANRHHACMKADDIPGGGGASDGGENAKHNTRKLLANLEPRFLPQRLALCNHFTAASAKPVQQTATKLLWLKEELQTLLATEPDMRVAIFTHDDAVQAALVNWLSALGHDEWVVDDIKQSLKVTARQRILDTFQCKSVKGARLVVATFKVAAVGLNLHNATRVYLLEPAFDPSVAVQAAGRVHRLGQTKEVKIVQLAYRGTLDVPILAVHDQIRDGVLKLQNGLLPPAVQAMFDAYRAKHKDQSCNNTAEISAKMRQLATARSSGEFEEKRRLEDEMPLPATYSQCSSCGRIDWSKAVFEVAAPRRAGKGIGARIDVRPRGSLYDTVSVDFPADANEGELFTFQYTPAPDTSSSIAFGFMRRCTAFNVRRMHPSSSRGGGSSGAGSSSGGASSSGVKKLKGDVKRDAKPW